MAEKFNFLLCKDKNKKYPFPMMKNILKMYKQYLF